MKGETATYNNHKQAPTLVVTFYLRNKMTTNNINRSYLSSGRHRLSLTKYSPERGLLSVSSGSTRISYPTSFHHGSAKFRDIIVDSTPQVLHRVCGSPYFSSLNIVIYLGFLTDGRPRQYSFILNRRGANRGYMQENQAGSG